MASENAQLTITHEELPNGGKYIGSLAGEDVSGHLEWEHGAKNVRIATHTIVPKAIGRRGVAAELVKRFAADARSQGFKIVPQCWYVAKKFDQNPDWADLRAEQ